MCVRQLNNKLFDNDGQQKPICVAKARSKRVSGNIAASGSQGSRPIIGGYAASSAQYQVSTITLCLSQSLFASFKKMSNAWTSLTSLSS